VVLSGSKKIARTCQKNPTIVGRRKKRDRFGHREKRRELRFEEVICSVRAEGGEGVLGKGRTGLGTKEWFYAAKEGGGPAVESEPICALTATWTMLKGFGGRGPERGACVL